MTRDQETDPTSGVRNVFHGINSEQMFTAETVPLPELGVGEILVKVIKCLFDKRIVLMDYSKVRLASICLSDVHTITGQRTEPTPR
jgi:hypothetical protein